MRWRGITVTGVVIAACVIALSLTSDFLVDSVWFSAVGYLDVFWTIFGTKVVVFFAVFVGSTVFLWVNGALALRFAQRRGPLLPVPFDQTSIPELCPSWSGSRRFGSRGVCSSRGSPSSLGLIAAVRPETGTWSCG